MGFVCLEALQQEQNMLYVMIMPEPLTAACGQLGTYVEPLTAACGSKRVKIVFLVVKYQNIKLLSLTYLMQFKY